MIVGDDSGRVVIFSGAAGNRNGLASHASGITRLDAGKLSGSDQIAVADGSGVQLSSVGKTTAPIWYTPLLAGVCVSGIILVAAWFIATLPAKPVLRAAAEDQSVEGLRSRRRMLHESLADVDRLRQSEKMPPDAYLARLRELRGELAETEAALQKAGVPIKVETFQCPHCGGTLPLGLDKCEYCGNVVIS